MNSNIISPGTKLDTFNGTLLVLLYSIGKGGLIHSCIVAGTGAAVSFIVSLICKWAWNKIKKADMNDLRK